MMRQFAIVDGFRRGNPMRNHRPMLIIALLAAVLAAGTMPFASQAPALAPVQSTAVTTPMEEWGHNIGDNYFLANYQQLTAYWQKLAQQSDRIQMVEIGRTSLDRPQYMAIITSPGNFPRLERYKEIARTLQLAEGVTDEQARALAEEGKAVVWIDGGLHATELLGAQQLMEQVYQMVSRNDEENRRILNDVITLAVHANPDGMDLEADHYMRHYDEPGGSPVLYNHYAGHDNNRDFYMAALPETENMNRIAYREWFPLVVYNHHQSGPGGSVMFAPPFRDPHNHNIHPGVIAGIDMVAAAMHTRFAVEGKPGVVSKEGASYSTWWNGGLRTTPYFHNQIGILTETIGSPTPGQSIPFNASFQVANASSHYPIEPQEWPFRNSIDYSVTANYAILDLASRYRQAMLYRVYRMGADQIQWGSEDHWTTTAHEVTRAEAAIAARGGGAGAAAAAGRGGGGRGGGRGGGVDRQAVWEALRTPEMRDPRGFIFPSGHPDFGTTVRFMNVLIKGGVQVHRATAPFTVNGTEYPADSFVVKAAQAYRPHLMDLIEPQDHPDDIPYEGADPTRPYDVAGWTLAYQMGVRFDRILDGFDGPFEVVEGFASPPAGSVGGQDPAGWHFSHASNDSFIAINRLLAAGDEVRWLADGPLGTGTFFVAAGTGTRARLDEIAGDLGVSFEAATSAPTGGASLRTLRIGLYDQYGGGMPSGWTRLLLENFEFPFEVVFPPMLDAGNLNDRYDVLVFVDSGLNAGGGGRGGGGRGGGGRGGGGADAVRERDPRDDRPPSVPYEEEFARRRGSFTAQTLQQVQQFVQNGGTVIAIGGASERAIEAFDLPLTDQRDDLSSSDIYVPGSVLRVAVDSSRAIAHGYEDEVDIFFSNSPTWNIMPGATNVRPIAWFDSAEPLRSGWAWGQQHLENGVQMAEATVGQGRVYVFGNALLFRTQPHGNYRFFFNGLYLSVAPGMR
jgi:hypothetical protein